MQSLTTKVHVPNIDNRLNGRYFKTLIEREFQRMFRESQKASKLFIQDGDPSQNSALARAALKRVGAKVLAIPHVVRI